MQPLPSDIQKAIPFRSCCCDNYKLRIKSLVLVFLIASTQIRIYSVFKNFLSRVGFKKTRTRLPDSPDTCRRGLSMRLALETSLTQTN